MDVLFIKGADILSKIIYRAEGTKWIKNAKGKSYGSLPSIYSFLFTYPGLGWASRGPRGKSRHPPTHYRKSKGIPRPQMIKCIVPPACLGRPLALLPVGCALKTSKGRCPATILIRHTVGLLYGPAYDPHFNQIGNGGAVVNVVAFPGLNRSNLISDFFFLLLSLIALSIHGLSLSIPDFRRWRLTSRGSGFNRYNCWMDRKALYCGG